MSYYGGPPQGHPPYGGPPPQQGYNQYPPQPHPLYPPTGQQPYGYPPQPQMNQPPYPPQQQPFGAPPAGYPPRQQQQWGAPAPGFPPQQPHGGHAPQGQWGAPVPSPGHSSFPPQQQAFNAAPPQAFGPPAQPSPGYTPNAWQLAGKDMNPEAIALRDAMKGFGTNETKLIQTMSHIPDAAHMLKLRNTFNERFKRDLIKDLESETSGYFRDGLVALARGPLDQDCYLANRSLAGLGTHETLLDDVLCGRTNADINAIKHRYHELYRKDLLTDVKADLSMKTEQMYELILSARRAEESAPVIPQQVDQDVQLLYRSSEASMGTDQVAVCQLITTRSEGQLRAINLAYQHKYKRDLGSVLKKEFSGHMEHALSLIVARAVDRAKSDADQLEGAMKGLGTKDELLVNRVVRTFWIKPHLQQVKSAYKHFHKQDLSKRIKGETRGDYERLMVALVDSVP